MHTSARTCVLLTAFGCVTIPDPAPATALEPHTFDFQIPGASTDALYLRAEEYFAGAFGDARAVFSLRDRDRGMLTGRAVASWQGFGYVGPCQSWYQVRFAAKEERARLQLTIQQGVPPGSPCTGWTTPTAEGALEMQREFVALAAEVEAALRADASWRDF